MNERDTTSSNGGPRVAGRASPLPKTTIVDIAAASGVSVTTVSRILNDHPYVAEATRQRVLKVMEEIGFAPQSAWRQIRTGQTRLIAMHEPQGFNPGGQRRAELPRFGLTLAAALGVEEAGYSINIITRSLTDAELLAIFRSRQADGMILLEIAIDDTRPEILRDHGYPFVMIGHREDNEGLTFVDIDIEHGITSAVKHLLGLGHERIGFLAMDPVLGEATYGYSTWARRAFEAACVAGDVIPVTWFGGRTAQEMTSAAEAMMDAHPELTALIAPQTQSLIGILRLAYRRSLRIPDDLSIVAVLSDALGELALPPLTTIDFPTDELGAVAARLMLEQLDQRRTTAAHVFVRPELTVRGSTGRPPGVR